jgi:hypothetical protein
MAPTMRRQVGGARVLTLVGPMALGGACTGSKAQPIVAPPAAAASQVDDASTRPVTTVATFTPSLPTGASQDGECWEESIAAPGRADAWRCTTGNSILDPCFSITSQKDVVVCRPNPITGDPGFILRLTKPLPARVAGAPSPEPQQFTGRAWLMRLIDGQTCGLITGTTAVIRGEPAPWGCTRGWVTRIDRSSPAWSAEWYPSAAGIADSLENHRAQPTFLTVTTGWE